MSTKKKDTAAVEANTEKTVVPTMTAEQAIAAMGGEKALEAKLKAVQSAKPDAFVARSAPSDLYQPKEGEVIKGAYLTTLKQSRQTVYVIATLKDGKATELKIAGAHSLNALRKAKPGEGVALTYNGMTKAEDGRSNPNWEVGFLANA